MQDFKLENFLPYRLSKAANIVSRKIAKAYKSHDLSPTGWRVLAVLAGGEVLTAREIANKTAMDKTTISRAIKSMQKQGLLKKTSGQDGRTTPMVLSASGMELFEKIIMEVLVIENEIKSGLSQSELDNLLAILERLAQKQ